MLLPQSVDFLPQNRNQVIPIETKFFVYAVVALVVRQGHALICFILGVPENWIKLLLKIVMKRFSVRS